MSLKEVADIKKLENKLHDVAQRYEQNIIQRLNHRLLFLTVQKRESWEKRFQTD